MDFLLKFATFGRIVAVGLVGAIAFGWNKLTEETRNTAIAIGCVAVIALIISKGARK